MYDYECDSASKEAYMYVSTCVDIRIGGNKLQCNHVHGVRVDDMCVQQGAVKYHILRLPGVQCRM